jgi:DNA-binding LytR/AlgR family response regulator
MPLFCAVLRGILIEVKKTSMNLFNIPGTKKSMAVPAEEIIRVEAVSNYSRIYFSNGKNIIVAKVLHWFEGELPMNMFTRVHRSHLVNNLYVQGINGTHAKSLLLYNGESITISRRKSVLMMAS